MNHLKKIFEDDEWGFDIELVKDIIITIKDNYPDIGGEFQQNHNSNGGTLKLFCKPFKPSFDTHDKSIIGKYDYTIDYMKKKNELIQTVTEVCERISMALDRDIKVVGLYDFDKPSSDGYINIHIMHK